MAVVTEIERLEFQIKHLQDELADERAEVKRLKAERHTTKQMLEDILYEGGAGQRKP